MVGVLVKHAVVASEDQAVEVVEGDGRHCSTHIIGAGEMVKS